MGKVAFNLAYTSLSVLLVVVLASSIHAQSAEIVVEGERALRQYEGELFRRQGNVIVIGNGYALQAVTIPANATLSRNGVTVVLDDLRIGDKVAIQEYQGKVTAVKATSPGVIYLQ